MLVKIFVLAFGATAADPASRAQLQTAQLAACVVFLLQPRGSGECLSAHTVCESSQH